MVQSENGTSSDLREICKDCRWWICLHILSFQPGGGVRSSGTPQHCQLIRAELPSNAYPRLPGSSESHRQFDFIRAELPSNGYPRPVGSSESHRQFDSIQTELPSNGSLQPFGTLQTTSAYLGRLGASTVDCIHTLRVPVPSGEFPRQSRAPIVPLPFSAASFSFLGSLRIRVRRWTP